MAPLASTLSEWVAAGLLALPLATVLAFLVKIISDDRNPYAWRKKR